MSDIELVIKIPMEIYEASQILDVKHEDIIQIPFEVIANGTPLSKGDEQLIDAEAEEIIDKLCRIGNSGITLEEYMKMIEPSRCEVPSVQPDQKWIPCKEKLPESDYETVLITGKMKYACEKEYEYFVDCAFVGGLQGTPDNFSPFDFETWNDWYEGQEEYYILAWMPLPEPFKAESEVK